MLIFTISFILGACTSRRQEDASSNPVDLSSRTNDQVETHHALVLPEQDEGTKHMVADLEGIYQNALTSPRQYYHLNTQRAAMLREAFRSTPQPDREMLQLILVDQLLYAGNPVAAINELEALIAERGLRDDEITHQTRPIFDKLALAYLRLGEQQNCIDHPAAEACIIPLKGHGIHQRQEGSRRAVEIYQKLLGQFPSDFQSRWLLNMAYMTLGTYPKRVPDAWRIDGLQTGKTPLFPRFPNVAVGLDVDVRAISGGVSVDDFNKDGLLDLFVTSYGLNDPVHLFFNDGAGGFIDRTDEAGLHGIVGGLNVIHADYDNDGWVDLFVLRGAWLGEYGRHPNSLLRNNGDGTFSDVTFAAGIASYHPTQTATWGDFNNDGLLDLFIGNETQRSWGNSGFFYQWETGKPHPCELFVNNGDGTFTEAAARVNLDITAFVKGSVWGDINNDGWPDLYVSVLGGRNRLFVNRGGSSLDNWYFEEIEAGVGEPLLSFPVWFWDYDQDGWEDLLVLAYDIEKLNKVGRDVAREYLGLTSLTEKLRLYRNNGDESFTDVTEDTGLREAVLYAMGSNFGDLNNDGYPDFYVGTGSPDLRSIVPNRMFLNERGERFRDVTFDGGFGHLQKGHGVAFADFDRDGDQDVYAVLGGAVEGDLAFNVLFENPGVAPENAWISLLLEGRTANRSAIGARIRIVATDRAGKRHVFYHTVSTGGSFGSSSLQAEIGLRAAVQIDTLQVTWPNRQQTVDTYIDLPVRKHVHLVEGQTQPTVLDRPAVPFKMQAPLSHHVER